MNKQENIRKKKLNYTNQAIQNKPCHRKNSFSHDKDTNMFFIVRFFVTQL